MPVPPPPEPLPTDPAVNLPLQRGLNRLYDIQLAIDVMLARSANAGDPLGGLVDPDRIAAGGHSIGGLSAIQLTGGDDDMCDTYPGGGGGTLPAAQMPPCNAGVVVPSLREPRIRALVLLDASVQLTHWAELHRIGIPALLVGEDAASLAANFGGQFPPWIGSWAHQAFDGSRSAHVPSLTSACAAARVRGNAKQFHDTRCDDPSLTPYQDANELVWRYAVAFLRTELADDPGFQRLLTPGWAVVHEPFATFYVNERKNGLAPPDRFGDPSFYHSTQPDRQLDEHPSWLDE
jgi:hypothetical protein